MNVTRDVINDLLPSYYSGDASADTRALVEEYLQRDLAFAEETRRAANALQTISEMQMNLPDAQVEKRVLLRAKKLLRIRMILLALAATFSLNALSLEFSFEIQNGHTHVHWLALPGQWQLVAAVMLLAILSWIGYFLVHRRVRMRVLG